MCRMCIFLYMSDLRHAGLEVGLLKRLHRVLLILLLGPALPPRAAGLR